MGWLDEMEAKDPAYNGTGWALGAPRVQAAPEGWEEPGEATEGDPEPGPEGAT